MELAFTGDNFHVSKTCPDCGNRDVTILSLQTTRKSANADILCNICGFRELYPSDDYNPKVSFFIIGPRPE